MEPSSFLMRFRWSIRHGGRSTARSAPRLASAIGGLLSSVPWPYPKTPAIPRSRVFSSAKDRCGKSFRLHHLTQAAHDQAIEQMLADLNATQTVFPGTTLTLVFKLGSA